MDIQIFPVLSLLLSIAEWLLLLSGSTLLNHPQRFVEMSKKCYACLLKPSGLNKPPNCPQFLCSISRIYQAKKHQSLKHANFFSIFSYAIIKQREIPKPSASFCQIAKWTGNNLFLCWSNGYDAISSKLCTCAWLVMTANPLKMHACC